MCRYQSVFLINPVKNKPVRLTTAETDWRSYSKSWVKMRKGTEFIFGGVSYILNKPRF